MRTPQILLFSGLLLSACSDDPAAPAGDGSLAVSTVTTGLDLDSDGYNVTVDGTVRAAAGATGTMVITQLDPGAHTIGLGGLAPNCTVQGPASQVVDVPEDELASLEFSVVCTATSGVIEVVVSASGPPAPDAYAVSPDGGPVHRVEPRRPVYLSPVSPGPHSVSLRLPDTCSAESNPRPVTLTVGGLIRDTARVAFIVACDAAPTAVWVTAPTTGLVPPDDEYFDNSFRVLLHGADPWDFPLEVGRLEANGTFMSPVPPGEYQLELVVPAGCYVTIANPGPVFTIAQGSTLDFEVPVTCPPLWDY